MKTLKLFSVLLFVVSLAGSTQAQPNWITQSSGTTVHLRGVYFLDANVGFVVGGVPGTILKTTDGGNNWIKKDCPINEQVANVYFTSYNIGYAVGGNQTPGIILKTTDGGETWTTQNFGSDNRLYGLSFPDPDIGYASGVRGTILKTTDAGESWFWLSAGTSIWFQTVFFTDINTGYVAGQNGTILKTIDGGQNWISLNSGTTNWISSIHFTDSNTGYAVAKNGTLIKTTNGGSNWYPLDPGTSVHLIDVYFVDSNTGYVTVNDGTILKTTNGGNTWFQSISGITNPIGFIHFPEADTGYVVGNNGTILKTTTDGVPVELSSFTAETGVDLITLKWTTQSETENYGFHVYRTISRDGEYQKITKDLIPGVGNSDQAHTYSYIDRNVMAGNTYYYKLADVDFNGNMTFHGPVSATVTAQPAEYSLSQNYPNPFNPATVINFSMKKPGKVSLKIFNLRGELVRTLVDDEKVAGTHAVSWDGTDLQGKKISAGSYIYSLKANEFEQSKKLIFMK